MRVANGQTAVYRSVPHFLCMWFIGGVVMAVLILEFTRSLHITPYRQIRVMGLLTTLALLTLVMCYLSLLLFSAGQPAVSFAKSSIRFVSVSLPWRSTYVALRDIRSAYALWEPTTTPKYVVIELNFAPRVSRSAPWHRVRGNCVYYECSNLTSSPDKIVAMIRKAVYKERRQAEAPNA